MAIDSTDLIFFAAQYPTDEAYGGGPMSGNVVQDGVAQNVFPVLGEADLNLGRVQLRKAYAAVLSANADLLVNASVGLYTPPTDPNFRVVLFPYGDERTTRSEAATALGRVPYGAQSVGGSISGSSNPYTLTGGYDQLQVGDRIVLGTASTMVEDPALPFALSNVATVEAITGASVTLGLLAQGGSAVFTVWRKASPHPNAPRTYGATEVAVGVSSGATVIPVAGVNVSIVPDQVPFPATVPGLTVRMLKYTGGYVPIFREGELILVRNAAGTTSEVVAVSRVNHQDSEIELAAPLANAYASGSFVVSLLSLGDLGASRGVSFSQQTWTRTFSDVLIGNSIGAGYNFASNPLVLTNEGAETERWAIVFTNDTDFKLIGERVGQIATGSTAASFAPLNPVTNQPYFTIASGGWGTGWQAGNVLRFNTKGARGPFWAARTTSPSPADGNDGIELQIRGSY